MGITSEVPVDQIRELVVPEGLPVWPEWLRYVDVLNTHDLTWLEHGVYVVRRRAESVFVERWTPVRQPISLDTEGGFVREQMFHQLCETTEEAEALVVTCRDGLIVMIAEEIL